MFYTVQTGYYQVYETFSCVFKRNLTKLIYESECSVRDNARTNYERFTVALESVTRVGVFSYLLVWRVAYQETVPL